MTICVRLESTCRDKDGGQRGERNQPQGHGASVGIAMATDAEPAAAASNIFGEHDHLLRSISSSRSQVFVLGTSSCLFPKSHRPKPRQQVWLFGVRNKRLLLELLHIRRCFVPRFDHTRRQRGEYA